MIKNSAATTPPAKQQIQPIGKESLRLYTKLLKYARGFRGQFILVVIGMFVFSVTDAGFAALMKPLLDEGSSEGVSITAWIPLGIIGILFLRGIGYFLSSYYMGYIGNHMTRRLRADLFEHLLHLPMSFYDTNDEGHIIARMTHNVTQTGNLVSQTITILVRDTLTLMFLLAWMIYLNWILTMIFVLAIPLVLIFMRYSSRRFRKISRRMHNMVGVMTNTIEQTIEGKSVIKSFSNHEYIKDYFNKSNEALSDYNLRLLSIKASSVPAMMFFVGLIVAMIVYLFTFDAVIRWITIGELVSFLIAAVLLFKPVKNLSKVSIIMQGSLAAASEIFKILDKEREPRIPAAEPLHRIRGDIKFRNVSMRYEQNETNALTDISFHIKPNQRIGLVGRSGAGKSSLVHLLLRFYNPTDGAILIDNTDISVMDTHSLREQIAYVGQTTMLFHDTIARNITCGHRLDKQRLSEATRCSYVSEFADRLSQGLDTVIAPGQQILSGGQRQRIALARCLYKDAPIVILDEATSALDSGSESYIQKATDEVLKERTCIIIAHRYTTIRNVDYLLVMDEGRLVETGTHEALLSAGGVYQSLYGDEECVET